MSSNNPTIQRIVFSDIDGTIYPFPSKKLNSKTKEDITKMINDNTINLVLTTGNPLLPKIINLGKTLSSKYLITSGGSLIYDIDNNSKITLGTISEKIVKKIYEIVKKENLIAFFYGEKNYYMINHNIEARKFFNDFFEYDEWVQNEEFLKEKILKSEIYFLDISKKENIFEKLKEFKNKANIINISTHLEITPLGVSKGSALEEICNILNADINHVMSIGDSENDISMFEKTQFSYAMDNANEKVKSKAKFYTSDVNQNGVVEAIKDYVFRTKIDLYKQEVADKKERFDLKEKRNEYYRKIAQENKE